MINHILNIIFCLLYIHVIGIWLTVLESNHKQCMYTVFLDLFILNSMDWSLVIFYKHNTCLWKIALKSDILGKNHFWLNFFLQYFTYFYLKNKINSLFLFTYYIVIYFIKQPKKFRRYTFFARSCINHRYRFLLIIA